MTASTCRSRPGEIHALLGENGAGKSTLVKILYGVVEPSAGEILWEGRPVTIASPVEARALGIGMVFQHFSLFDELTVAENIAVALSDEWSLADRPQPARRDQPHLRPRPRADRAVWTLSAGERQRIEIVRCLLQDPRLLILDEPTSVLTPQEAEHLFVTLDKLSAEGVLDPLHLPQARRGAPPLPAGPRSCAPAGSWRPSIRGRRSAREIAALMVGQRGRRGAHATRRIDPEGEMLQGRRACRCRRRGLHGQALADIDLVAHAGEVVGIAGVAGNGQSELFAALSGERLADRADAIVDRGQGLRDAWASTRAAGSAPRSCRRSASAMRRRRRHRLSENTLISHAAAEVEPVRASSCSNAAKRLARAIVQSFDVRMPEADPQARKLSGGNLQKFVIGREIIRKPEAPHRRPADLGRRCGRRAPDPPGAGGSRDARAARSWWSARISTSCSKSPTAWR